MVLHFSGNTKSSEINIDEHESIEKVPFVSALLLMVNSSLIRIISSPLRSRALKFASCASLEKLKISKIKFFSYFHIIMKFDEVDLANFSTTESDILCVFVFFYVFVCVLYTFVCSLFLLHFCNELKLCYYHFDAI